MSSLSGHKKKVIPVLVILIIAAAISILFFMQRDQEYMGEVEATIFTHTAEVSGKIIEMSVELGQHVSKGDVLAVIDSTDQTYALEQLTLALEKKKLALADIQVGASSGSSTQAENRISIAQASYNSANAAYEKAYSDFQNAQKLYAQGAIAKDAFDNAKLKSDSTQFAAAAAKAQLDTAKSQSSVASMELDIAQTESQIQQMKETLKKFSVTALQDGVVMSKSYVIGDMVSPGYQLIDLASDNEKYFVFYLPKEKVHTIDYNSALAVTSNGNTYDGIVKYIDVKSEYTPKDMQTIANKNRDSIKIKLLLPDNCPLKPGESAAVKLDTID